MRINGEWYAGDNGIERPVVRGEIWSSRRLWAPAPFLVDTGADRTVFSAAVLADLHLQQLSARDRLASVGGLVDSVLVETRIRFYGETGTPVVFQGQYAAIPEVGALDISILGRAITSLFAVIVDQPGNLVCLLAQRHRYTIELS